MYKDLINYIIRQGHLSNIVMNYRKKKNNICSYLDNYRTHQDIPMLVYLAGHNVGDGEISPLMSKTTKTTIID